MSDRNFDFTDELRRHNFNPIIQPDDLMGTALNVVSAILVVEDFLDRHTEELPTAVFGHILLLKTAREAAHFINTSLDVASLERKRETAGGEND